MHFKVRLIDKFTLINFFILSIPLTVILGNLAININILIISFIGFFIYKFSLFKFEKKIYDYLLLIFFLYLILITIFSNYPKLNQNDLYKIHIIKSFLFLRFFFFYLVLRKLIENNKFYMKYFLYSCCFFSVIIGFDVIFQALTGKNLTGSVVNLNRPSSFFGEELIAGSFLQKFSTFSIFILLYFFRNKKNFKIYLLSLFILFFIPTILTANRMPTLILFFSIILFLIIEKQFKTLLITFLSFFIIISLIVKYPPTKRIDTDIKVFYLYSIDIIKKAPELFYYNSYKGKKIAVDPATYLVHFNSGIQTWKKNKIFGAGLKSFRLNCIYGNSQTCNSHPHNYFIEILLDVGILGLIIIYSIYFKIIAQFLKYYWQETNLTRYFYVPFFLIYFFELFPFRSTGSFFTTGNMYIHILVLSILVNIYKNSLFKIK